jgi:hypothetical protein
VVEWSGVLCAVVLCGGVRKSFFQKFIEIAERFDGLQFFMLSDDLLQFGFIDFSLFGRKSKFAIL